MLWACPHSAGRSPFTSGCSLVLEKVTVRKQERSTRKVYTRQKKIPLNPSLHSDRPLTYIHTSLAA